MTKKVQNILSTTKYSPATSPAICLLVEFACQKSGINPRDYYDPYDLTAGRKQTYFDGVRAYRAECRSISADLKQFKEALQAANAEGVTDAEVIAEAPHAFSGRLEWKSHKAHIHRITDPAKYGGTHKGGKVVSEVAVWSWEYTTGQYFATEYRKAASTVLEAAIRRVRQGREPNRKTVSSIAELKALNEANGGCWFDKGSMRFFNSRIESGIIKGKYFITSEQSPHDSRKFSVRSFDDRGDIDTIGEFCTLATKADAKAVIAGL